MVYYLIFCSAGLIVYGLDGVIKQRILISIKFVGIRLLNGSQALIWGIFFMLSGLLGLLYSIKWYINQQNLFPSILTILGGVIFTLFFNKWLYDPKTLRPPSNTLRFKILIIILKTLFLIFILLFVLLIPLDKNGTNLYLILFSQK